MATVFCSESYVGFGTDLSTIRATLSLLTAPGAVSVLVTFLLTPKLVSVFLLS